MTEPASTANEPAPTPDVASAGDPASQIVADAQNKFGPPPSVGEPTSTEPPSPADVTGQPADETPPDDSGLEKRTEQENAVMRSTLTSLGIDPDSEKVERFKAGLITKEELLGTVSEQPQENLSAIQKFNKYKTSMEQAVREGKTPSTEDFLTSLQLTADIAQEGIRDKEITARNVLLDKCQIATEAVITSDEFHSSSPENIQGIERQVFLGSTDCLVAEETGGDPRYVTPKHYDFYARKNMKNFTDLRNYWIEYGKKSTSAPVPPPTPNQPNPISSAEGGGPMAQPKEIVTLDNMERIARDYKPLPTRV